MTDRTSIFATPKGTGVDVSDFKPKVRPEPRPEPEEIDRASQGGRFPSRDPSSPVTVNQPPTKRRPMVYRTGRNVTFSAKATPATYARFYDIAERQGWKAAETFEKAVESLERELGISPTEE